MEPKELLCSKIENYISSALEKEFLEATVRIDLADIPVSDETILAYDRVFSDLDDDELWIRLHNMNKKHNIPDELLFERYVDKLVEQCLSNDSKPDNIQKINIYHVKPLSPTKWVEKLELAQIRDPNEEIDNDRWENEIKTMMESVLKTLETICKRDNESDYRRSKKEVLDRFPLLRGKALEFFVSAEVFYKKFEDEDALDYAPVLMEYCRSIETALWEYIYASDIYREQGMESEKYNNQGKTFGAALYAIKLPKDGPLSKHYRELNKLVQLRNNSAHTSVTREPDVRIEREKIWESDLLDTLCAK